MSEEIPFYKSLKLELEPGQYFWCSCRDRQDLVICDQNHSDCKPLAFVLEETRLRSYCTCKQTKTPPFCDGFHKELNTINHPEAQ